MACIVSGNGYVIVTTLAWGVHLINVRYGKFGHGIERDRKGCDIERSYRFWFFETLGM